MPMRIAFYGGSFDPVHVGHTAIAAALIDRFRLDRFLFVPAFHAPHKKRSKPTPAYHRYAMLALATNDDPAIRISATELENPELPFTVETQLRVISEFPEARIFFVIGADSWSEISTWREWERVLTQTNIIVITRPGYSIAFSHVTDDIRGRIVDLRGGASAETDHGEPKIYITDAVNIDVSASRIRQKIREGGTDWRSDVPEEVAKYLEKYQIYN